MQIDDVVVNVPNILVDDAVLAVDVPTPVVGVEHIDDDDDDELLLLLLLLDDVEHDKYADEAGLFTELNCCIAELLLHGGVNVDDEDIVPINKFISIVFIQP